MNTLLKGFLCLLMFAASLSILDNSDTWMAIIDNVQKFENNALYDIFDKFEEIREEFVK